MLGPHPSGVVRRLLGQHEVTHTVPGLLPRGGGAMHLISH